MTLEKTLRLKGIEQRYPIIQGGMGIGVSGYNLVSRVGELGAVGTLSSAGLDQLARRRLLSLDEKVRDVRPGKMDLVEATMREIADVKSRAGVAAINIMCAVVRDYEFSVEGAVRGKANAIISGAGLPLNLPSQVKAVTGTHEHDINLIPIISSARALKLLCKFWDKQGYRPDAIVLEGFKAGGHIGWNYKQIEADPSYTGDDLITRLLPEVLKVAEAYPNDSGPIPVFAAGGIFSYDDIKDAIYNGAAGVQMGSRFAMTEESGFTDEAKQIILNAEKDDIVLADQVWGSPCKYPFRYVRTSPLKQTEADIHYFCICSALKAAIGFDNPQKKGFPEKCPEQYLIFNGNNPCAASGSAKYEPLVTCGSEAYRIDKVVPVEKLMAELTGKESL